MIKSILILYNEDDWSLEAPAYSEKQKSSYDIWGNLDENIQLTRSSILWYRDGIFTKYWKFDKSTGSWIKIDNSFTPNAVFDKSVNYNKATGIIDSSLLAAKIAISQKLNIINYPEFTSTFDNKLQQAFIFENIIPSTKFISKKVAENLSLNDFAVFKRIYGSGGKEVEITKDLQTQKSSLIGKIRQDFVKSQTSDDSVKDYRVVYLGNRPIYSISRISGKGSLFTNLHMGGSIVFNKLNEITDLLEVSDKLSMKINTVFDKAIFALDFMKDENGKYFLIEMNTMPGLDVFDDNHKEDLKNFLKELSNYLLS